MQAPNRQKKVLIALSLALSIFIFWKILAHQKAAYDVAAKQKSLVEKKSIIELKAWDAVFYFCSYAKGAMTSDICMDDSLRAQEKVTLPLGEFNTPTLNFQYKNQPLSKPANTVKLTYTFSEQEKEILKSNYEWMLLVPRNAHRATFLGADMSGVSTYGHVTDSTFGVTLKQLMKEGKLEIIVNYKSFTRFGPLDMPVVLAKPDSAREYLSLFELQTGAAALSKQFLVGVPLVMSAIASVLDHSPTMFLLALFGVCRSVFSYLSFLSESAPLSPVQIFAGYASLGASLALLLMFVEKLAGLSFKKIKLWHRITFTLACALLAYAGHFVDPNYQVRASLWIDSIGAMLSLALLVIAVSPSIAARLRKNNVTTRAKQESDLGLSKTLVAVQLSLAAATFIVSGSVNISELTGHLQGTRVFVDPLDWRHMMLMPALLTAGLLEVGSIAKRMLTFGHEMAEKAVIEKELMVGRDVQARMLPDKRFKGDYWKWRAIYHPAEALAGDWFDIREVEFKDGRKLLAVCLADVTGHGVGSSLSTSVICSHWSLWCAQLGQLEFPAEKSDREKVLCSAPIKIHDGLSALRKNENCTSMIALIDPYAREVTLTSAGHPGALIIGAKGLRYVTTAGERLGGELIGEAKWTPRTEALGDDDMLVIYSDGIVPVGATVLAWAGQLKKKMAAGSAGQPELLLMRTLHDNKRAFMKDPSNEDDMTLIMLRRG